MLVCVVDGLALLFVLSGWLCRWFIAAGKRPVPFRTRKLSLRRADGTALGRVWESRLLPTLYNFMFGPVGRGFIVCTLWVFGGPGWQAHSCVSINT